MNADCTRVLQRRLMADDLGAHRNAIVGSTTASLTSGSSQTIRRYNRVQLVGAKWMR